MRSKEIGGEENFSLMDTILILKNIKQTLKVELYMIKMVTLLYLRNQALLKKELKKLKNLLILWQV